MCTDSTEIYDVLIYEDYISSPLDNYSVHMMLMTNVIWDVPKEWSVVENVRTLLVSRRKLTAVWFSQPSPLPPPPSSSAHITTDARFPRNTQFRTNHLKFQLINIMQV